MADDDVLINFDVGSELFVAHQKFKGGKWKDRLQAKKSSQKRQTCVGEEQDNISQQYKLNGSEVADFAIEQPAKRVKITKPANRLSRGASHASKGGQPRQVVSSLFSYNPSSVAQAQSQDDGQVDVAKPSNAPLDPALQTFTSLGLSANIASHLLNKMEIKAPTAIQRDAVPQLINEDVDAFIQAETGSGKTLAYLLPIVQRLAAMSSPDQNLKDQESNEPKAGVQRSSGLFAIIIAPTRELCKQISVVLETLLRCAHWIVSTTVSGGEKKKSEKARLRKGINILIATPGRLADHIEHTTVLDVSKVRWLVMDEGDRLMELGFEKDIDKIFAKLELGAKDQTDIPGLPKRRVTVLCSATMKADVLKLGERSLKDAVHVRGDTEAVAQNGHEEGEKPFSAPAQLQQSFAIVPAKLRLVTLAALLKRTFARKGSVMKTILFMSCADSVDLHFSLLASQHDVSSDTTLNTAKPLRLDPDTTSALAPTISSTKHPIQIHRLHGSLPQHTRTSTLARYRTSKDPSVLICTDVASRGLDLPNVDFVIEYDPPFSKDDHLHRIGRTARAGKEGRALIFLMPGCEEGYVDILKQCRADGARMPVQHSADELLRKGFTATGLDDGKKWQDRATDWQLAVERWVLSQPPRLEMARRGFQAHVRAYATHVASERHIFDITQLHLGHLAKAFGLRDKPGSMRVPGLRPSKFEANRTRDERKRKAGRAGGENLADGVPRNEADTGDGKEKMRAKMKEQARLSEFNLG